MSRSTSPQRHLTPKRLLLWVSFALSAPLLSACERAHEARALLPYEPEALALELKTLAQNAASGADISAQLTRLTATREELLELLEPNHEPSVEPQARTLALTRLYLEQLAQDFKREAPQTLAAAHRLGLTEVALKRVGPGRGDDNTPGDLKLLEALPKRPPLYHARLLSPEGLTLKGSKGLRLNGFVFVHGRWVTLLKLGEALEPWRVSALTAQP